MALVAFPAVASASVSPWSANLETGDFSQFDMGGQTAGPGASISVDTSNAYDGAQSGYASYAGGGSNNYARGAESVNWNDGDDVWYGEAVYLPVGFKSAMQGQVDLFRWDDYPSYASGADLCGTTGGLVIWGGDKQARFVNDSYVCNSPETVLVGPFSIPEGQWNWFDVHQVLSETDGSALTELYMNGTLVGSSTLANKGPYSIARMRYGLVAIAENAQTNPLSLWFDRAYIDTSQLGPLSSGTTTTPPDTAPPTSSATASVATNSSSISVSYTAADNAGGSGLAEVDLYAKAPGQGTYSKVASDTSGAGSGLFNFTASAGDGTYSFYTLAIDKAGNVQSAPASAQAMTVLDSIPPSSSANAPTATNAAPITVSYTASDNPGGSGLAEVDLYAKVPGQGAYSEVASDTSGNSPGSFAYNPSAGGGTYSFYTLATDKAGNVQAAPASPQATTVLDSIAPTSTASSPAYANTGSWTVSYSASDNGGGDAVSSVELWARPPDATSYAKVATNTASAISGSFTYAGSSGDGSYAFYTIAVDQAGNRQLTPSSGQTTTVLDTVAPTALQMNNPGQYLAGNVGLSLSSAPLDSGSGMASVTYQYRPTGGASWSNACVATAAPWSCSWNTATGATPDGQYDLQAVAIDKAGNKSVASNTPFTGITLENTKPAAKSISATNVTGGTAAKIDQGDKVTFTYTQVMKPSSIMSGWNGASTAVHVNITYNSSANQLTVRTANGTTTLPLVNPLKLGGKYVGSGGAVLNGTMVQNGTAITVTLGSLASGSLSRTPVTGGALSWTPSSSAANLAGINCSTTSVSSAGPAF